MRAGHVTLRSVVRGVLAAVLTAVLIGACGPAGTAGPSRDDRETTVPAVPLPPDGGFDYQLGGAYEPPDGTTVVARDATQAPAPGRYGICYLNGFQSQPGEAQLWDGLLLEGPDGAMADPGWPDEYLLDTSTPENRAAIAAVMTARIHGCAGAGYDAVELDNLDSYLRSDGLLAPADNLALARLYVAAAHEAGLAVAQKNALEIAADGAAAGFDFAVTEECGAYDECAGYLAVYDVVLDIEYGEADAFAALCRSGALPDRAIRRDLDLTTPASPAYVFGRCP